MIGVKLNDLVMTNTNITKVENISTKLLFYNLFKKTPLVKTTRLLLSTVKIKKNICDTKHLTSDKTNFIDLMLLMLSSLPFFYFHKKMPKLF